METFAFETDSPDETLTRGVRLGEVLADGDFVALDGPLGAGKTLFARGVATGAGVDPGEVASPTYAVLQSYQGRIALHHADLYRLSNADELLGTGYFDELDAGGAALVEWCERISEAAPPDALYVRIGVLSPSRRIFQVRATGPHAAALRQRWLTGRAPRTSTDAP